MNGSKKRRRSRVNGFSVSGIQSVLMEEILPVTGGYIAGSVLSAQLTALNKTDKAQTTGAVIKSAAGLALALFGNNKFLSGIGVGMAVNGMNGLIKPALDKAGLTNAAINLLPPGRPSMYIAGAPGAAAEVVETPGPVKITML